MAGKDEVMKNDLPEMTEGQLADKKQSADMMKQFGNREEAAKPHIYTRTDTQEKIILLMTYSENFARQYSRGAGQSMAVILADGTECFYDLQATRKAWYGGNRGIETAGNYPMASYALGIDPSEVAEYTAKDNAAGVPTEYNNDGEPIFTSKKHRRDYCHAHNVHDRNGGYSDP